MGNEPGERGHLFHGRFTPACASHLVYFPIRPAAQGEVEISAIEISGF
jgi:hypothetical protein